MARVEEVYCLSGVPALTFVKPPRYDNMLVSVRTPGRCSVFEGPSGIGKTTVVAKLLEETDQARSSMFLSARKPADLPIIEALPELGDIGVVVLDDFHRLDERLKNSLSDFMKLLADRSDAASKLIMIGINKAGTQLIQYAHDLGMRLDRFRLESNPEEKLIELIELGEGELNIRITEKAGIAKRAYGSFHITQMLCHNLCVESGVLETLEDQRVLDISSDVIAERAMDALSTSFQKPCIAFAGGSKIRPEGRAPYLHILKWLSESDEWSIDIAERMRAAPEAKASVGQVIEKMFLDKLLAEKSELLSPYFHYQPETKVFSIEDPKLVFYLKNLVWRQFTKKVGYKAAYFTRKYDIALSFAGPDRAVAKMICDKLVEREVAVFFDSNEQHRIIAANVEDYLAPIYRTEAVYVVPLLSPEYPKRIWTKFESDQFQDRFGEGAVIPIRFRNAKPGFFSSEQRFGSLSFDPVGDVERQVIEIVDVICKKLEEDKATDLDN